MTASLNSDAINFPVENGRRYHAYQSGGEYIVRLLVEWCNANFGSCPICLPQR